MNYIQISEPIFLDLLSCKSKVDDIKYLLMDMEPQLTRRQIIEQLLTIVYGERYQGESHSA